MKFCTAINCMDGRVQLPVIKYLRKRFRAEYVDSITEAGPNLILSEHKDSDSVQSILDRVRISVEKHKSGRIAVVGHYDCAGNPAPKNEQKKHILTAVNILQKQFNSTEVIGLWVNNEWEVEELY